MEVLSSRVLLHPVDFERSFRFYAESLGLHVYREWSSGSTRGVVFFLDVCCEVHAHSSLM